MVPPGRSVMGSPESELGRDDDEGPQRVLSIEYSFAAGVYEVTFDEWGRMRLGGWLRGDPPRRCGLGPGAASGDQR